MKNSKIYNVCHIGISKLDSHASLPEYAHIDNEFNIPTDVGMDLKAVSVEYKPDIDTYVYHTGLTFEIPVGYGIFIFPKSRNRKTDAYIPNSPCIIDPSYNGEEVMICYKNRTSLKQHCTNTMLYKMIQHDADYADYNYDSMSDERKTEIAMELAPYEAGQDIAQMVLLPYPITVFNVFEKINSNNRGGFGSTGDYVKSK